MPQFLPDIAAMRVILASLLGIFWALAGPACGFAAAARVPLPPPRPHIRTQPQSFAEAMAGVDFNPADETAAPTPCDRRVSTIAEIKLLPWMIGPGACGGHDMVALHAVTVPDGTRVAMLPAPVLRCAMAESVAAWVRDAAAPDVKAAGGRLRAVDTYDDYDCRPRNRRPGAKLSEHGKGNAVDIRALTLTDGRVIGLTDMGVDKRLRESLRDAACRRFTTVLGPGADPYHSGHVHLDIEARHNGYRICQWEVRVPPPPPKPGDLVKVPLPPVRGQRSDIGHR